MRIFRFASGLALLGCVLGLSACGGGSNGTTSATSSVSTLTFSAASPSAATPDAQTFSASLGTGTRYLVINHNGQAVSKVNYTLNGNTAEITAYPSSPASIGSGVFTSTIDITGYGCADSSCSQMVPGNTATVTATYTIPLNIQFVAPYVGTTYTGTPGLAQSIILRGQGFQSFAVQDVQFVAATSADYSQPSPISTGGISATSFRIINDTEIKATYPAALTAGTYMVQAVTPSTSAGPATTLAYLVLQNPTSYSPTTISYPSATSSIQRLIYDAQRQALLVARTTSTGTEIDRFTYASAWSTATSTAISGLADIALTPNGQQLLALSQTDISLLDPANPASSVGTPAAVPALASGDFYLNLAVTNNNNAIVTTGYPGSATTPVYVYSIANKTFTQPAGTPNNPVATPSLNNCLPGVSSDGSLVALAQGYSGAGASSIYTFSPETMWFEIASNQTINQYAVMPALDRTGTTMVLNGTNVYTPSFIAGTPPVTRTTLDLNLLGTLPATTEAVVLSPDANYAYTLDSGTSPPQILKFDLSATPSGGVGGAYQSSSATTLTGDPGSNAKMTISPDGGTLFIAGNNQIVVQPTPP